jgi:hypothetical protein
LRARECGRSDGGIRQCRELNAHLGVGAARAGDLDGLGAAVVGLVHHKLDLLALSQRAEAVRDDVGLRRRDRWISSLQAALLDRQFATRQMTCSSSWSMLGRNGVSSCMHKLRA